MSEKSLSTTIVPKDTKPDEIKELYDDLATIYDEVGLSKFLIY